jgi:hypothetical protein
VIWFQWEAARVVEAEGGLEELDPRVSAPLRSTRRFGSNGKQPVWWRLREVLRSSTRAEFSSVVQHTPMWF